MKKIDWTKLTAISEIVGTVAVVISLIFVGVSIRQNTAVVQANQQNLLYELTDSLFSDMVTNPELYELLNKGEDPESLTLVERQILVDLETRGLNVWENAYFKYQTGLLTEDQYRAWHEALSGYVKCCMQEWLWEEMRDGQYRSDFVAMIDAILADKQ